MEFRILALPQGEKMKLFSSLRSRILLLLLAVVLPVFLLLLYSAYEQRQTAEEALKQELVADVRILSGLIEQKVEGLRQLLIALAYEQAILQRDAASCNKLLAKIKKHFPEYTNFGVADPKGNIFCSAVPMTNPVNASELLWFRNTIKGPDIGIGEYQTGRITGKHIIIFGYAARDGSGRIQAVVFAPFYLDALNELLGKIKQTPETELFMLDRNGTILVRRPDHEKWVGKSVRENDLIKTILNQHEGLIEAKGVDGIKRIYSFIPVAGTDNSMFISVGISKDIVFADINRQFARNLMLFGLLAALSFAAAITISRLARQSEEELIKHREHLEELVNKRTAELMDSQSALMGLVKDLNEKSGELKSANERLREIDHLKSMFIASMSHELRTPLNSVIGFSSILLNQWKGPLNDEQTKMLSTVLRSGRHLLALINDVIDVSKIEAGMVEAHIEGFDLYGVIGEAVDLMSKDIAEKRLELNIEAVHLSMRTDRRRFLQCVLNLLSNAVKFTGRGSVRICAQRVNSADGDFVEISVSDTGIGINKEDIPKLFLAFSRLDSPFSASVPGTGLGLYLTKKLVTEVLKGVIIVESEYGKGSRFVIKIPVLLDPWHLPLCL